MGYPNFGACKTFYKVVTSKNDSAFWDYKGNIKVSAKLQLSQLQMPKFIFFMPDKAHCVAHNVHCFADEAFCFADESASKYLKLHLHCGTQTKIYITIYHSYLLFQFCFWVWQQRMQAELWKRKSFLYYLC